MKAKSRWVLYILLSILVGCAGCPMDPFGGGDDQLVILSYNCQNLFDDVDQGSEYSDYDPSAGDWTSESYLGKLSALAQVIQKSPEEPDVLLLQEVENRGTLERLSRDFLPFGSYDFYAAPQASGAAVQTGVISRIPVERLTVHRPGGSDSERNILEVWLDPAGDENHERIVLLNNHWKSRLGGAEETEPQRIRAALLIKRRAAELYASFPGLNVILAGDFNEDPWETGRDYPVALGSETGSGESPVICAVSESDENLPGIESNSALRLFSFWTKVSDEGSYCYRGVWERIDHFFWNYRLADSSGWDVSETLVLKDPLLLNEYGTPLAYDGKTMTGYSDHLPLLIILEHR